MVAVQPDPAGAEEGAPEEDTEAELGAEAEELGVDAIAVEDPLGADPADPADPVELLLQPARAKPSATATAML